MGPVQGLWDFLPCLRPRRNLRLELTGSLQLIACGLVGSALGLCLISVTYLPRILGKLFDLRSCICKIGTVLSSLRIAVKEHMAGDRPTSVWGAISVPAVSLLMDPRERESSLRAIAKFHWCWWELSSSCTVSHGMFGGVPGLYPDVSGYCQMTPWGQSHHRLSTPGLGDSVDLPLPAPPPPPHTHTTVWHSHLYGSPEMLHTFKYTD